MVMVRARSSSRYSRNVGSRAAVALVGLFVAGCSLGQAPPPAGFLEYVQSTGAAFEVAEPPAGEMQRDEALATVRGERERHAAFTSFTPLDATFGVLMCPDVATCRDAFSANLGEI